MFRSPKVSSLEALVVDGEKPGAYTEPWRRKRNDRDVLESLGLEVMPTSRRSLAIAYPRLAAEVLGGLSLGEAGNIFRKDVVKLAGNLGDLSISAALASLADSHPSSEREDPEVAILQGALLGYDPCCVDYYVATHYLGEAKDPASEALRGSKASYTWADAHILCGACAVEFLPSK